MSEQLANNSPSNRIFPYLTVSSFIIQKLKSKCFHFSLHLNSAQINFFSHSVLNVSSCIFQHSN